MSQWSLPRLSFWNLPVGGVQKTAETIDYDPTKASSGRGRIRLEKTVMDGVLFTVGYDHRGECVYIRDW